MRFDALYLWRIPDGIGGFAQAELTLDEGRACDAQQLSGPIRVVGLPETPDEILESWMTGQTYLVSRELEKKAA